jgi:D-alanyl-D-alanine dipeptidase
MSITHPDFVSLSDICPELTIQASYSSADNFTGSVVAGYQAKKAYLAKGPAKVLCQVQKVALAQGLTLKIFDGYRPVKAVQFFIEWAQRPEENPAIKEMYYPNFTRLELFENGYIAKASSHSRGSAVDLTLVDVESGIDLDMGSSFDYFDDISHTASPKITSLQKKNRMLLKNLMESQGFVNYSKEWWHFSFRPEPFPGQPFDFDVK